VSIERVWSTTFHKDNLVGRFFNGVTTSLSITLRALRRIRRDDGVLVVTNPPLLPFLVLLVCRLRGARCVLLVHDVHPEQMVAFGMLREGSAMVRIIKFATGWLYRHLAHVVVIGRDMAQVVRRKAGTPDVPITVATNWADDDVVQPRPKRESAMLQRLGWTDAFVVQYAGNMGRPNAIELIVEAATILRDDPRIRFLFVGSGAKLSWLQREVAARRLANVVVEKPVPRSEQTALLSACDVGIVPLIPGMLGLGVPSRTYNVLAAGRPLVAIAHPESEVAQLVREEHVGWAVADTASPEELVATLRAAARMPVTEMEGLRRRARDVAVNRYGRERILAHFDAVLRTTAGSTHS
jgi:glycosyltransferase involved in cell wall biosynthesis